MCKKLLQQAQMSDATYVDECREKTLWLVQHESRGPGDTENAMRRIARRYGIDFSTLWGLRYRPPKDLFVSAYFLIATAYEAERVRQLHLLEAERRTTTPRTQLGRLIAGEAAAVGRADAEVVRDGQ